MSTKTLGIDDNVVRKALSLVAHRNDRIGNRALDLNRSLYLPDGHRSRPSGEQVVLEIVGLVDDLDASRDALLAVVEQLDPDGAIREKIAAQKAKAA